MRFHTTTAFQAALTAHREAYAAHDVFAEAGDDGVKLGGTPESDAASAEEYRTLSTFALYPCTTPAEAKEKLQHLRRRGPLSPDNCIWDGIEEILDRFQSDLVNMQRPNVSPAIAEAFDAWATANVALHADPDTGIKACSAAERLLYATPCTTPGDFIAKAYVNLLGENGAVSAARPFEIDLEGIDEKANLDNAYQHSAMQDIMDSDLGLCMALLGRTYFDAEAWIAEADACGHSFAVLVHGDGSRSFSQGMDGQEPHATYCIRLLAGGLGPISDQRIAAVADAVQAGHPAHLVRTGQ